MIVQIHAFLQHSTVGHQFFSFKRFYIFHLLHPIENDHGSGLTFQTHISLLPYRMLHFIMGYGLRVLLFLLLDTVKCMTLTRRNMNNCECQWPYTDIQIQLL